MAKKSLVSKDLVIDDEKYPDNSISKRVAPMRPEPIPSDEIMEEGKLIESPKKKRIVRKGHAQIKKKTLAQTVAATFFSPESGNVVRYIFEDILIPAAKSTISDMVQTTIEMVLFGESRGGSRRGRDRGPTKISYGSYFKSRDDDDRYTSHRRPNTRRRFDLDDITFRDGAEAAQVLEELCDQLEEYDQVSVAEFYDLAGVEGKTWVHDKFGWTNLKRAYCSHTRDGYIIVFPDPIELD